MTTAPAVPRRSPLQHDFRLDDIRDSWLCKRCGQSPQVLLKDWVCPGAPSAAAGTQPEKLRPDPAPR